MPCPGAEFRLFFSLLLKSILSAAAVLRTSCCKSNPKVIPKKRLHRDHFASACAKRIRYQEVFKAQGWKTWGPELGPVQMGKGKGRFCSQGGAYARQGCTLWQSVAQAANPPALLLLPPAPILHHASKLKSATTALAQPHRSWGTTLCTSTELKGGRKH